jgi:methyl-accepting chemotaxis protein
MDLQQRQIRDKNKSGCIAAVIATAAVLLVTLLGFFNGGGTALVVRTVVGILVLVALLGAYSLKKDDPVYRHVCGLSMIVLYVTTLFTTDLSPMYAVVYPIAIMCMIFGDKLLVNLGTGVGVGFLIIHYIILGVQGQVESIEAIINITFTIVTCVLVLIVVYTQIRHTDESIGAVRAGLDAQLQTSSSIVELAEQLNRKFVQAQEMSDTLNETMDTTHASVSEIADSSKMTADAIEQQTSQTSDIQQSIQEVGEQARNMGAISDRTNTTVEEGVVLIDKLKAQAEEVAKINIETRTTTQALNESIKDVQAITETILGISSQTNLLALNASIEAARAGEAGKGFAVVADEIRTLSESTRQATEQISSIIERLTKDAQSAAESMTQSANVAQQQNVLIEETGNKLNDIKTETDELHEGVMQVNGSVQNIISANSMIMDSITNLSATSEEVAASTDTVLSVSDSSMDALKDMNGILGEISAISRQLQIVANNQAD